MIKEVFFLVMQLLLNPQQAWKDMDAEAYETDAFLRGFLHPIMGGIALCTFVGGLWFSQHGGVDLALKKTIVSVVSLYGGFLVSSYFLNELAPRYGLHKHSHAYKVFAGYASVPLYVVCLVIPFFSFFFIIWLFVFYTIYIVYVGAKQFLRIDEVQRISFSFMASALLLLSPGIIYFVMKSLIR